MRRLWGLISNLSAPLCGCQLLSPTIKSGGDCGSVSVRSSTCCVQNNWPLAKTTGIFFFWKVFDLGILNRKLGHLFLKLQLSDLKINDVIIWPSFFFRVTSCLESTMISGIYKIALEAIVIEWHLLVTIDISIGPSFCFVISDIVLIISYMKTKQFIVDFFVNPGRQVSVFFVI